MPRFLSELPARGSRMHDYAGRLVRSHLGGNQHALWRVAGLSQPDELGHRHVTGRAVYPDGTEGPECLMFHFDALLTEVAEGGTEYRASTLWPGRGNWETVRRRPDGTEVPYDWPDGDACGGGTGLTYTP